VKTLFTVAFVVVITYTLGICVDVLSIHFFHHEPTLIDAIAVGVLYWIFGPKKDQLHA
jgi:hypothetical protein